MGLYSGTFSFTNNMGAAITSGSASHWTTDYGTETIDLSGLPVGGTTIKQSFTTSSSNVDRWSFTATLANGVTWSVKEKDCGFEGEDNAGNVSLSCVTYGTSGTFNIVPPKSGSCNCSANYSGSAESAAKPNADCGCAKHATQKIR